MGVVQIKFYVRPLLLLSPVSALLGQQNQGPKLKPTVSDFSVPGSGVNGTFQRKVQIGSSPVKLPELLANWSDSMPRFCSMLTKRLQSGVLLERS
jgi:hypothetical protein